MQLHHRDGRHCKWDYLNLSMTHFILFLQQRTIKKTQPKPTTNQTKPEERSFACWLFFLLICLAFFPCFVFNGPCRLAWKAGFGRFLSLEEEEQLLQLFTVVKTNNPNLSLGHHMMGFPKLPTGKCLIKAQVTQAPTYAFENPSLII